ncbi:hypothetical protein [Streptomyces sp. NPDC002785]|uniref:hypothetical protein n=1 Tax=Streptomyces sp. NPDC002785 TaxID=3154543 RepID=UPI00332BDD6B
MRLLRLRLPFYRGLRHFELDLAGALDGGHTIATLIGPNGGGKSRALHALAEIFGALHRPGRSAAFAFELDYEVHDRTVRVVQTSPDTSPELTVDTSLGQAIRAAGCGRSICPITSSATRRTPRPPGPASSTSTAASPPAASANGAGSG